MDEKRLARTRERTKERRKKQVKTARIILAVCAVILCAAAIFYFKNLFTYLIQKNELSALKIQQEELTSLQEEAIQERIENTVHLVAVGDNLIHEKIYDSGIRDDGSYSYDHLYENIKEEISTADIAVVNEECIFVTNHADVSAYPDFGAPTEIGDALVNAGFDVFQYANNHTFDKGAPAIFETINFWKQNYPELTVLGIHNNKASADNISTITCKGITFAMLNYTSFLNENEDSTCPPFMIDMLSYEQLEQDVQKAKELADVTIAFLHIGEEYSSAPSAEQMDYLHYLLELGVDITICSHPHVLQNYDVLQDENGNQMLVYYSLGNFISTQKDPDCLLGGMAEISIYKNPETKELIITNYGLKPLVTHYNYDENIYTVYKLEDYTEELAKKHSIHEETDAIFTVEWLQRKYDTILNTNY